MISDVLRDLFSIGQLIYQKAMEVKANQAQCQRLAERVRIILSSVHSLENVKDSEHYREPLLALLKCLNECAAFIDEFTASKKWYEKVITATSSRNRFWDYAEELRKVIEQLNIGLGAQQLINSEQDKKDQEKDREYIREHQDEILKLNQEAREQLGRIELKQEEYTKILARQLASLRGHICKQYDNKEEQQTNDKSALAPFEKFENKKTQLAIDQSLLIPYYEIQFSKKLSSCYFGSIYLGSYLGNKVAVKSAEDKVDPKVKEEFINEVKIMSTLRHPNVVQLIGACMEDERLCIIMEYMEQGSLSEYLAKQRLTTKQQKEIALDLIKGLQYLHNKGVVHSNFESSNILLDANYKAKIADFRSAKTKAIKNVNVTTYGKSIEWKAPECLKGAIPTEKSDIYGLGIIFWEIMSGCKPYDGWKENLEQAVIAGKREIMAPNTPSIFRELITKCWDADPDKRPLLPDILAKLEQYVPQDSSLIAEELYQKGVQLEQGGKYTEAYYEYKKSADQGYMKAITNVGFFKLKGLGPVKANPQEAYNDFLVASKKGHVRAMFNLASLLENGAAGVPKDIGSAMEWYKKAGEGGDSKGTARYALLLKNQKNATSDLVLKK